MIFVYSKPIHKEQSILRYRAAASMNTKIGIGRLKSKPRDEMRTLTD